MSYDLSSEPCENTRRSRDGQIANKKCRHEGVTPMPITEELREKIGKSQQPQLPRPRHRLRVAAHVQLAVNVLRWILTVPREMCSLRAIS
jgi:hypothetical protein